MSRSTLIVLAGLWLGGCSQPPAPTNPPHGSAHAPPPTSDAGGTAMQLELADANARMWTVPAVTRWQPPAAAVPHDLSQLIVRLASGTAATASAADWQAAAQALGMTVERWVVNGVEADVLREAGPPTGLGTYAFRRTPGRQRGVILQAPHAYFDEHTGAIAAAMFWHRDSPVSVLMTNNIHRYAQPDGKKQRRDHNPADITHDAAHGFALASAALARGAIAIVQLHGFDRDGGEQRADVDAIVSTGTRDVADSAAARFAAQWQAATGLRIRRYGLDIEELGGTQNPVGQLVRAAGGQFIHVECAAELRRQLTRDAGALMHAMSAIVSSAPAATAAPVPYQP